MYPEEGRKYLGTNGINLFHVFDTASLADLLQPAVSEANLSDYPSTVLIANAGSDLWHAMQAFGTCSDDPIDEFSIHLASTYARDYLKTKFKILYPSNLPISLRAIGSRTGWCHPSPLGLTIHPEFGTWYAFRALFLVKERLPASEAQETDHPCETCEDKPCIPACPVNAVGEIGSFDLDKSAHFRLRDSSPCAYRCLSRISCPVGTEYQYVPQQMKYHYQRSRSTIAQYYRTQGQ